MEQLLKKHWHHLSTEQVTEILGVDPEFGLDRFEREQRKERIGPNSITTKPEQTSLKRFFLQFHQPLVYILLMAALVTGLLQEWVDSGVILGVVVVNALVGFLQESKAARALSSLATSLSREAELLFAGATVRVDASDLVPGDIVLLRAGDKLPADVRLVSTKEMRVDESTLTGESLPVDKSPQETDQDAVLADRTCMAYAGTLVINGQGKGVVVATANDTEIGKISGMVDAAQELQTPLTRKIASFSHILLVSIICLAVASFVVGILRSEPATEMFMAAVALAVGAIPEGLPAAVTIILALGVSRMAGRKTIIRRLPAVETLGGTTVICTDKTGTLTENKMTVQQVFSGGLYFDVSGSGYSPEGEVTPSQQRENSKALAECFRAGLLCNDSRVYLDQDQWLAQGDPTEAALLVSAGKYGLDAGVEQSSAPRVDELPFSSERQFMATLHRMDTGAVLYVKGGVERVLERCESMLDQNADKVELDAEGVLEAMNGMAAQGLRVLALARKEWPGEGGLDREDAAQGLVFLGLQGMIDPPRPDAREAIAACRRAGVAVKMITGDHAVTAQAIGSMLGLCDNVAPGAPERCTAITGREIGSMNDMELMQRAGEVSVFARVSPEQKLRLVMALQANGEVCAMTGDGVNDAPALKQANIGIAMGRNGTEAAKEASDMVLTDDNFATIKDAVEEGRCVFANLVKFIAWTLPTNAGEGLVILAAVLFGATLPILPVQILWINMTTAGFLGLTLAFEPKEPGIMDRPPRRPDRPLLDRIVLRRVGLVSFMLLVAAFGLFEWELTAGASVETARTVAVNVFVVVEAFYLFNARSFHRSPMSLGFMSNPWVMGGVVLMVLLQAAYTYVPFMNTLFSSAPLGILHWVKIAATGCVVFALIELDKRWAKGNA
ncbi:MAG: cation-transporting P-type ATPase [Desulfovibrio sp.]|nr:MAG: cation-transporting P-type ATPase [Desulfovibrio sp.]